MNELVRLTTQDVSKAIVVTGSKDIALKFGKTHKSVLRTIENLMAQNSAVNGMFEESSYLSERGRFEKEYSMNRDGFSLLVMGFTGEKALKWKLDYIKAFNFMEKELLARIETRHIGIGNRKLLTDTIRDKVDEGTMFKNFAYSNYSKLVYKKVLGMTVKQFKERNGIPEKDNIRNHMNVEQLEKIQEIESKIATYLEIRKDSGETDKQIYEEIKNYIK